MMMYVRRKETVSTGPRLGTLGCIGRRQCRHTLLLALVHSIQIGEQESQTRPAFPPHFGIVRDVQNEP